jgi:hypothetical protein
MKSSTTTSVQRQPRNVVFLIAAIQAFLVSFPSLVLPLTKARCFSCFHEHVRQLLVVCLYVDGAIKHPLMVILGSVLKLVPATMLILGYLQGKKKLGVVWIGAIPDLLLGMVFVKAWIDKGATFCTTQKQTRVTSLYHALYRDSYVV